MSEFSTRVGKVLKQKSGQQVWSTTPETTVFDCIKLMAEKQVGALLVMKGETLEGIISERDYARKLALRGLSSKQTLAAEIMTSPVLTVTPKHTVGDCMLIITEKRIRHLPVMDGGRVLGVISIGDLVNCVISEQESTIRHLQAYIAGTPGISG
jgi:CBS domain-containing protein